MAFPDPNEEQRQSLGKLKGSTEAAGRDSLDAVNMTERLTARCATGTIGGRYSLLSSLPISSDAAMRVELVDPHDGGATRSAPFWDITQRPGIILYRRFGTTYRSHLQG